MKHVNWLSILFAFSSAVSPIEGMDLLYCPPMATADDISYTEKRGRWDIILSESYTFGKFAGFNKNYFELDLLIAPPRWNDWQGFVDLQGFRIGNERWGGSAGAGLRWWDNQRQHAFGANIYYDYREEAIDSFQRIGVGLEWLGRCWDLRLNGYIPANGSEKACPLTVFTFPGGFVETCQRKQQAFSGIDGEVGVPIPFCHVNWLSVYNALGGYYYRSSCDKFYGGYYRLELNMLSYLSVEGRFSYDSRYHAQAQGVVYLNLPLYDIWGNKSSPCTGYNPILIQSVYRNPMITTQSFCEFTQNW